MLEIDPKLLLAQIVTFLVALFLLWKIAWKPVLEMMRTRAETIRNALFTARKEQQTAEELKGRYEQMLSDAKSEAQRVISLAVNDGNKERDQIVLRAREESERILESARRDLKEEKDRLVAELRSEVAGLAVSISEKLLQKAMDKPLQDRLLKEAADNFPDAGGRLSR